jgi:hypothetical protein
MIRALTRMVGVRTDLSRVQQDAEAISRPGEVLVMRVAAGGSGAEAGARQIERGDGQ